MPGDDAFFRRKMEKRQPAAKFMKMYNRKENRNRVEESQNHELEFRARSGGIDESVWRFRLVGASALDVARLLAAVADSLAGRLRRAITGQVADLSAYAIC